MRASANSLFGRRAACAAIIFCAVLFLPPHPAAGAPSEFPRLRSLYVPMRDGTKIAVDVWLPAHLTAGRTVPALMRATRYWRAQDVVDPSPEKDSNSRLARISNDAGYALVLVDARGTGASFGSRAYEMTADEVKDYGQVADWVAAQPWSNRRIGAFGVSYEGNTSEMLVTDRRPFIKAVAPLFNDFNYLDYLAYPGGLFLDFYTEMWGGMIRAMDRNDICGLTGVSGPPCEELRHKVRGVKPVDADTDRALLAAAVAEHGANVDVADAARRIEFKDDPFGPARVMDLSSLANPSGHVAEIQAAGTPMFIRVGWLDAATANGALSRFLTVRCPQTIVIGPWSHGGGSDTDPFLPPDTPARPTVAEQVEEMFDFFDRYLKTEAPRSAESVIRYYTMGAGTWSETRAWPPEGSAPFVFYMSPGNALSEVPPGADGGGDSYLVDYGATTGTANRWHTNIGGGDVVYPDRAEEDRKLLTYTSPPLAADTEITGSPLVTLCVSSTAADGAFFVYLEAVAPDGRVTYITEGELRGVCRAVSREEPPYRMLGPYRTFSRRDAKPLVPGETVELTFDLWATSAMINKGSRVRIAVAGADKDNFARYPLRSEKPPTIVVERNRRFPSRVVLPTRNRHKAEK